MTFAFLAFTALLVLAACFDYSATHEPIPTTPYDDLLMRQAAAEGRTRHATARGIPTHRGERHRPGATTSSDVLSAFDPTYYRTETS